MEVVKKIECFRFEKSMHTCPIFLVKKNNYKEWLERQNEFTKNFLMTLNFNEQLKNILLPKQDGTLLQVICLVEEDMFTIADLYSQLPDGEYHIEYSDIPDLRLYYLGFALGSYSFDKYKKTKSKKEIYLFLPKDYREIISEAEAIFLARDMISTPAEDMGPAEISNIIKQLAIEFNADFEEIIGEDLAKQGYMGIYTVGRGSYRAPRLVKLNWNKNSYPKISLVGKGVVFDTGGVDIKPASGMLLMHKDMGGAANAIALAYLIMKNNLPVGLSLSIPTVENAVDANSYRPSDIIKMKNGTTVQVTNTDAEGRLILAEPLYEESSSNPAMLIDFATLTGAARIAVGTEIAGFFSNNNDFSDNLYKHAEKQKDDVWRLPLAKRYMKNLKNDFADISNCGPSSFAGAITAALFLEHFLAEGYSNWIHFDIMAWNSSATPGKPIGGEAMGIRAVYSMLKEKFNL
ncbi:leucyl aminopeptidase family protein [Francisella frigiditurris]|uniref:Cytosol aminopeptidase n=1 Tax=Francisella frigiditurris TaxID=1542390 RepID=A0A1J0KU23_9GAMM|nr:leucyl aminopeptidase family protein [Francisella frigiditurris]APC97280.1 cytosol aminopeptidase [Francisella frigiditurris]